MLGVLGECRFGRLAASRAEVEALCPGVSRSTQAYILWAREYHERSIAEPLRSYPQKWRPVMRELRQSRTPLGRSRL